MNTNQYWSHHPRVLRWLALWCATSYEDTYTTKGTLCPLFRNSHILGTRNVSVLLDKYLSTTFIVILTMLTMIRCLKRSLSLPSALLPARWSSHTKHYKQWQSMNISYGSGSTYDMEVFSHGANARNIYSNYFQYCCGVLLSWHGSPACT